MEGQKKGQNQKPRIGENAKINEELAKMAAQQEMIRKMILEVQEVSQRLIFVTETSPTCGLLWL